MSTARCEHGLRWFRSCLECARGSGALRVDFIEVRTRFVKCPTCGHSGDYSFIPLADSPQGPYGPRCDHGEWPESATGCIYCGIDTAYYRMRAHENLL